MPDSASSNIPSLPFDALPPSAIEAIYHAATGKTETLTENHDCNVVVRSKDLDRLYQMIMDQLGVYNRKVNPTVTVVSRFSNDQAVTYSSWARYKALQVNNHELTSEFVLKIECIVEDPNTKNDQRIIVNVSVDSALPILNSAQEDASTPLPRSMWSYWGFKWRTAVVTIDFVDFLIAKSFANTVREWFESLPKLKQSAVISLAYRNYSHLSAFVAAFGRIGFAIFLAFYAFHYEPITLNSSIVAASIGLAIWGMYFILENSISASFIKSVSSGIIPSVILITDKDELIYEQVCKRVGGKKWSVVKFIFVVIFNISLNIMASVIYASYFS